MGIGGQPARKGSTLLYPQRLHERPRRRPYTPCPHRHQRHSSHREPHQDKHPPLQPNPVRIPLQPPMPKIPGDRRRKHPRKPHHPKKINRKHSHNPHHRSPQHLPDPDLFGPVDRHQSGKAKQTQTGQTNRYPPGPTNDVTPAGFRIIKMIHILIQKAISARKTGNQYLPGV